MWKDVIENSQPAHSPNPLKYLSNTYYVLSDKPRLDIKKQRHHFADKIPSSQSYGFSSTHVYMWKLDHRED